MCLLRVISFNKIFYHLVTWIVPAIHLDSLQLFPANVKA